MLKIQKEALESGNEEEIRLLSDQNIGHIVHELFGGGIESTTMTILWFILYLIHNPQVREKNDFLENKITCIRKESQRCIVQDSKWVSHITFAKCRAFFYLTFQFHLLL